MRRYFIIVFVFAITSCSSNNENKTNKFEYPGLGMLIESYYRDYYDYPKTVNDLISFINACKLPENFDTTIEKLKNNRDKIVLNNENDTLIITLEDSVIYETAHRSPCDELSYNMGFYLGRVLFFDEKGLSVTSEEILNQFKSGIKEIKFSCNRVKKEGDTNKYVMLNFESLIGLTLFCNENIQLKNYEYFRELEKFLDVFSEKYHINRMVFITPIFY